MHILSKLLPTTTDGQYRYRASEWYSILTCGQLTRSLRLLSSLVHVTTSAYKYTRIKNTSKICRVEFVLNSFVVSSLPCFYAFCWYAIPTFFNAFYSCSCHLFLAADACLSWSLPSITEQQVFPHRLPMQYWHEESLGFKDSPHTNNFLIQQSCVIITFRC